MANIGAYCLIRTTFILSTLWQTCFAQNVTAIGMFFVEHPAYATLYENVNATSPLDIYDLLISNYTAKAFSKDSVMLVKGIGNYVKNMEKAKLTTLTTKPEWPNEVAGVPEHVFGKRMVVIPNGFILSFKTEGGVRFMDLSQNPPAGPNDITGDIVDPWFYHRVRWNDMDGDGDYDVVTCRARQPKVIGKPDSELLWLENPGGDVKEKWKPHILGHGPDLFFEHVRLNSTSGPLDCIVVAQFFTQKLAIYWTTDPKGIWTDMAKVKSRDIDATIGDVFDVGVYDLNNDGTRELLVTVNGINGSVLAYEIPQDFRTGQFIRHTLSTGYQPLVEDPGKGAPGTAFPVVTSPNTKPIILLSGADNGNAFILTPKSQDPADWQYTQSILLASGTDTVGQLTFADVDGERDPNDWQYTQSILLAPGTDTVGQLTCADVDGRIQVIVPCYTSGQMIKSQDPGDWQYTQSILLASGTDTMRQLMYADVDGDGRIEFFVPCYTSGQMYVYRIE